MSLKTLRAADRLANRRISEQLKQGPISSTTTGASVRAAERLLKLAGYDVKVDGKLDAKSLAALAQFDAAAGNPADGVFDQDTFAKLKGVQQKIRAHHGDTFLGVGQAGEQVAAAERQLKKLGYEVGKVDGVFDADTAKAVKAFKKAEGIKGDSEFLGNGSTKQLAHESAALNHEAYRGRVTKNLKAHRRLDAATAEAAKKEHANGTSGIGAGSPARVVKNVQAHLRAAGFNPSRTDGVFDSRSQAALEAFQKQAGLSVTGRVGEGTWKQLAKATFEARNATSPAQRLGEKSAAVLRSEKILRALGYKGVKADGIFDRATQQASRRFEQKFPGLGKDGAIDAKQLERMQQVLHARQDPGSGPMLKKGYRGRPVTQLERRLKRMGFNPGKIDGKFSKATAQAVKKFQRAFAMNADGVVGKKTWRMLGVDAKGAVHTPGGGTAAARKLVATSRSVAMSMGGYSSQGLCATGVSRALSRAMGISVYGNGNQIDNNLPRDKFKQVHMSLAQALKTPGLILTWEKTSTTLGSLYGHTAITWGDGHTSSSDFIESNTLGGSSGRSGLKIFKRI